jgi:hypothetical protein
MSAILLWIAWFLGSILAYSAVAKTSHPLRFANHLVSLDLVPPSLSWLLALTVLLAESALAGLMLVGVAPTPVFCGAALLLAVFTGFVTWAVLTGQHVRCYCFGAHDAVLSTVTLKRNAVLLGLAVTGGLLSRHSDPVWSWPESVIVIITSLASALVFLAAYQLATFWSRSRTFI